MIQVQTDSCLASISRRRHSSPRLYLLYHELRSGASRYSYATEMEMFKKHVDIYVRLRRFEGSKLWPKLTFDDGHISNIELAAPVLESRGLTAQFFITVGWTGKKAGYMDWTQLQSLHAAGHSIGAHGWTHTLLTHCSDQQLQTELNAARAALEDKLGASVTTMSLPGGRYNRRVIAACGQAGYTTIYTSIPRAEPVPPGPIIGRLNIIGNMQPDWIARLFSPGDKLLDSLGTQYRRKEIAKKVLGDKLYAKLWAMVNRKESGTDGGEEIEG